MRYYIIADDNQVAFWSLVQEGTGSYDISLSNDNTDLKRGADSLKIDIIAGTFATVGISHTYTEAKDFSTYQFLALWFEGSSSGDSFELRLGTDSSNYYSWTFTDDYTGWHRYVFKLSSPNITVGSPNLSNILYVALIVTPSATNTYHLDRLIVEQGSWYVTSDTGACIFLTKPRKLDGTIRRKVQKYPIPGRTSPFVVDIGIGDYVYVLSEARLLDIEVVEFRDAHVLESIVTIHDLPIEGNYSVEVAETTIAGGSVDLYTSRMQYVFSQGVTSTGAAPTEVTKNILKYDLASSSKTLSAGACETLMSYSGYGLVIIIFDGDGDGTFDMVVTVDGSNEDSFSTNESVVGYYAFTTSIEVKVCNNTGSSGTASTSTFHARGLYFT